MVNVYIVHSGKDYEYVKNKIEPYLTGKIDENGHAINGENNANILTLKSGIPSRWKKQALKQIKMAQIVIVLIGADSFYKTETMGWEVYKAFKLNKQIFVLNPQKYTIPDFLSQLDQFSQEKRLIAEQQTIKEVKERIDNFAHGYYRIFSRFYEEMQEEERTSYKSALLDQYKMFQKSSEDLVSRRQSVNSFYISVSSTMVALMGLTMGVIQSQTKIYIMLFMCVVAIILDISWLNILDSYGTLNSAKMKVINLIEEQLPMVLYEAEWRVMSDKLNSKRYVSFTESEKRIPKIFMIIHTSIIVIILVHVLIW